MSEDPEETPAPPIPPAPAVPAGTPTRLAQICQELGFRVLSYDKADQEGALMGPSGEPFVGPIGELLAYVHAWSACRSAIESKIAAVGTSSRLARQILPMSSGVPIMSGISAQITHRSRVPFRGERVVIPDDIAPWFQVNDVLVGNRSQFLNHGPVPGVAFACRLDRRALLRIVQSSALGMPRIEIEELALAEMGLALSMETAQVAMDIVMVVTARENCPPGLVFDAFIVGKALR